MYARHGIANENRLNDVLGILFPAIKIVRRARRTASVRSPASGRYLEVDFWIEQFNLAFEYQEEYHYDPSAWYSNTHDNVKHNDNAKQTALKSQGRTLIQVPFWWDGAAESLAATIIRRRPDLEPFLASFVQKPVHTIFLSGPESPLGNEVKVAANLSTGAEFLPIPDCPPDHDRQEKEPWIPGIGQLMFSPLLKSAHVSTIMFSEKSASGWWMSEKYDGTRACWVHSSRKLYSPSGNPLIFLQEQCSRRLCSVEIDIDCEIWYGRGTFIEAFGIRNRNVNHFPYWKDFRILLYDCPSHNTKKLPYEERCELLLKSTVSVLFAEFTPQMKLNGKLKQLENVLFDNILPRQGAGIIFKLSDSPYAHGCRDPYISLQIKARRTLSGVVVRDGAECNHSAFFMESLSGDRVHVTLDNVEAMVAPSVGDFIEVAINSNINGFPSINADILVQSSEVNGNNWDILLAKLNGISHSGCKALLHYLHQRETFDMSTVSRHRQYGYWTEEGGKNIKAFFDGFAKRYKLGDPDNPQTWYFADSHALKNEATFIRHHYGGSVATALMDAYPNIGLDPDFLISKGNYFREYSHRKAFFDRVALGAGFDPTGHDHKWHTITRDDVLSYPGGTEVLDLYGGSMIMGLCDVYPDLRLKEELFEQPRNYWHRNLRKQLSVTT